MQHAATLFRSKGLSHWVLDGWQGVEPKLSSLSFTGSSLTQSMVLPELSCLISHMEGDTPDLSSNDVRSQSVVLGPTLARVDYRPGEEGQPHQPASGSDDHPEATHDQDEDGKQAEGADELSACLPPSSVDGAAVDGDGVAVEEGEEVAKFQKGDAVRYRGEDVTVAAVHVLESSYTLRKHDNEHVNVPWESSNLSSIRPPGSSTSESHTWEDEAGGASLFEATPTPPPAQLPNTKRACTQHSKGAPSMGPHGRLGKCVEDVPSDMVVASGPSGTQRHPCTMGTRGPWGGGGGRA